MLTLPNWLSILRILITPFFTILLLYRYVGAALAIFALAALTDALDGFIARSWGQKSDLGMVLDPLADKLLVTAGFISFTILEAIPRWLTIIVLSRDLFLIGGSVVLFMFAGKIKIPPTLLGKGTTVLQLSTLLVTMVLNVHLGAIGARAPLALLALTAAATVLSGLDYVIRGARHLGEA
ncbi:MAG TPA: CDP-diacylglycerol--glycerol-3-phosphate 3-phosphatidyltransferase [Candidatus Methylomirabilis sp.]